MRDIRYITIHCTGSIGTQSTASIKNYWKTVMKWKSVGYHFLISKDGSYEQLEALADRFFNHSDILSRLAPITKAV